MLRELKLDFSILLTVFIMDTNKDLDKLIRNLPLSLQERLKTHIFKNKLIEIVLDLGRRPEARFLDGPEYLSQKVVSWQDIDYITKRVSKFSNENRAGIERTLHRISCIRNRQFLINGVTCRVGRVVFGTISVIRDLLESEKSILILGKPGVGKTTIIREISRVLSDEMEKRVIIIDTSNEIAGDSDISHSGIGRSRRMQVPRTELQHQIMIEAVENHMPQIVVIDEIGTEFEVLAAKTIAEKGIQLIGTTHGNYLKNLIKNPSLSDLIGGIQYVTLSDEEAKRRKTQKSIIERKAYPTFEIVIEINQSNSWTIHENINSSVDLLLNSRFGNEQIREFNFAEKIQIKSQFAQTYLTLLSKKQLGFNQNLNLFEESWTQMNRLTTTKSTTKLLRTGTKELVFYSYAISNNLMKEVFLKLDIKFRITPSIREASFIIGLKKSLQQNFKLKELAKEKQIPIYSLEKVSFYQFLRLCQILQSKSKIE